MPILALIIFGIIDFGRAFYTVNNIISAVREGARYGAILPAPMSTTGQREIRDRVRSVSQPFGGDSLLDSQISIEFPDGELVTGPCRELSLPPPHPDRRCPRRRDVADHAAGHVPLGARHLTRTIGRRRLASPLEQGLMAQRRYTIVFYAAVFIAAMATYGVYRVLQAAKNERAGRDSAGRRRGEGHSRRRGARARHRSRSSNGRRSSVPKDAITSLDAAGGRVTRVPVFAGEAIVPGRLAREGTAPGLEARISPGMRAMSVRINDVAGMSGLIQPNSRVDVLVSLRERSSTGSPEEVSKLFLENMRVLSMGSRTTRDDSGDPTPATTATLEVTPTQAEKLAVAMRQGMIQLVLRGFDDSDSTRTKGSSSSEVLAQLRDAKPAPVVAQAPTRRRSTCARSPAETRRPPPVAVAPPVVKPDSLTVRVYRGNQVTQQKFQVDTTNGNGTATEARHRDRLVSLVPAEALLNGLTASRRSFLLAVALIACTAGRAAAQAESGHRASICRLAARFRFRRPFRSRAYRSPRRALRTSSSSGSARSSSTRSRRARPTRSFGRRTARDSTTAFRCTRRRTHANRAAHQVRRGAPRCACASSASPARCSTKNVARCLGAVRSAEHLPRGQPASSPRRADSSRSSPTSAPMTSSRGSKRRSRRDARSCSRSRPSWRRTRRKRTFSPAASFPIPVVQVGAAGMCNASQVTIEYREFGVRLNFLGEIISDSLVKLRVRPEVSSLDFANAVLVSGFRVPAFRTRRVESTVDVRRDRSLIISGMFGTEEERVKTGIPAAHAHPDSRPALLEHALSEERIGADRDRHAGDRRSDASAAGAHDPSCFPTRRSRRARRSRSDCLPSRGRRLSMPPRKALIVAGAAGPLDAAKSVSDAVRLRRAERRRVDVSGGAWRSCNTRRTTCSSFRFRTSMRLQLAAVERAVRGGRVSLTIGTAPRADSDLILRAMRSGIQEFLVYPPDPKDLATALDRLMRRVEHERPARRRLRAVQRQRAGSGRRRLRRTSRTRSPRATRRRALRSRTSSSPTATFASS